MPKFTVVVPVYKCADYLSTCVSSVLNQSEYDFELILVDDGSPDASCALCDQLAQQDNRIRVFHKSNGGASSARNLGLNHATGDYVLFFDGDDTVEPDLLERVSTAITSSPEMVIFGMAFDYYNAAGKIERTEQLSVRHSGTVATEELLSDFSSFFEDNALSSACNKVFSGRILRETGLRFAEGMTLYEDLDFVLRYLPHCSRISFLNQALYHYRHSTLTPHINQRVLNLDQLNCNLAQLTESVLALNSPAAAKRTADLCAQLYDQHLMSASHARGALSWVIAEIQASEALLALAAAGISPSDTASASWPMISKGETASLYASLKKRKMIRNTKRLIKPSLKKIGLYH